MATKRGMTVYYVMYMANKANSILGGALTYTLVKFSVPPPCHGGVVTAIHLGNVISLDVGNLVHG